MSMDRIIVEEARLIILKALAEQLNERLNSSMLEAAIATFGIARPRAWVHQQMDYLREMGAVTVEDVSTVKVATLTETGSRHLRREIAIEGVKRPSRPEA